MLQHKNFKIGGIESIKNLKIAQYKHVKIDQIVVEYEFKLLLNNHCFLHPTAVEVNFFWTRLSWGLLMLGMINSSGGFLIILGPYRN